MYYIKIEKIHIFNIHIFNIHILPYPTLLHIYVIAMPTVQSLPIGSTSNAREKLCALEMLKKALKSQKLSLPDYVLLFGATTGPFYNGCRDALLPLLSQALKLYKWTLQPNKNEVPYLNSDTGHLSFGEESSIPATDAEHAPDFLLYLSSLRSIVSLFDEITPNNWDDVRKVLLQRAISDGKAYKSVFHEKYCPFPVDLSLLRNDITSLNGLVAILAGCIFSTDSDYVVLGFARDLYHKDVQTRMMVLRKLSPSLLDEMGVGIDASLLALGHAVKIGDVLYIVRTSDGGAAYIVIGDSTRILSEDEKKDMKMVPVGYRNYVIRDGIQYNINQRNGVPCIAVTTDGEVSYYPVGQDDEILSTVELSFIPSHIERYVMMCLTGTFVTAEQKACRATYAPEWYRYTHEIHDAKLRDLVHWIIRHMPDFMIEIKVAIQCTPPGALHDALVELKEQRDKLFELFKMNPYAAAAQLMSLFQCAFDLELHTTTVIDKLVVPECDNEEQLKALKSKLDAMQWNYLTFLKGTTMRLLQCVLGIECLVPLAHMEYQKQALAQKCVSILRQMGLEGTFGGDQILGHLYNLLFRNFSTPSDMKINIESAMFYRKLVECILPQLMKLIVPSASLENFRDAVPILPIDIQQTSSTSPPILDTLHDPLFKALLEKKASRIRTEEEARARAQAPVPAPAQVKTKAETEAETKAAKIAKAAEAKAAKVAKAAEEAALMKEHCDTWLKDCSSVHSTDDLLAFSKDFKAWAAVLRKVDGTAFLGSLSSHPDIAKYLQGLYNKVHNVDIHQEVTIDQLFSAFRTNELLIIDIDANKNKANAFLTTIVANIPFPPTYQDWMEIIGQRMVRNVVQTVDACDGDGDGNGDDVADIIDGVIASLGPKCTKLLAAYASANKGIILLRRDKRIVVDDVIQPYEKHVVIVNRISFDVKHIDDVTRSALIGMKRLQMVSHIDVEELLATIPDGDIVVAPIPTPMSITEVFSLIIKYITEKGIKDDIDLLVLHGSQTHGQFDSKRDVDIVCAVHRWYPSYLKGDKVVINGITIDITYTSSINTSKEALWMMHVVNNPENIIYKRDSYTLPPISTNEVYNELHKLYCPMVHKNTEKGGIVPLYHSIRIYEKLAQFALKMAGDSVELSPFMSKQEFVTRIGDDLIAKRVLDFFTLPFYKDDRGSLCTTKYASNSSTQTEVMLKSIPPRLIELCTMVMTAQGATSRETAKSLKNFIDGARVVVKQP